MDSGFKELLERYEVGWPRDNAFQRRVRLLQSVWREERGYACGSQNGKRLGSRLETEPARDQMWNFLTSTIADRVGREISSGGGKVIAEPRIYDNLLSSQPLCFNLFAELAVDLRLATRVFSLLWPEQVKEVTEISFEFSPGRGDERYLGNRSAFDAFVRHTTPGSSPAFIGIEVKYHENLGGSGAKDKPRYEEVAANSGAFRDPADADLRKNPLQQLWLDHLLALSMLDADAEDWGGGGRFVFLHPTANRRCAQAAATYRQHLTSLETFEARTLEEIVAAIRWHCDDPWIREFTNRYVDIGRLEDLGVPPLN
jgi:hypothetical protein